MSASGSPPEQRPVIADTVVVNYFLAVGALDLLRKLIGGAVRVPRAVFDPDEGDDIAEEATSELRRGLRLHRRRSQDKRITTELQQRSARALPHFESLPKLVARGELVVVDLSETELETFVQLRDKGFVARFSLIAGLGRGEAAALALALGGRYDLATDDEDAIRVLKALRPGLVVMRIRALLRLAVDRGLLGRDAARTIHREMVRAGFWDRVGF
ncbi:MAG: hypothetical protein ACRD2T_02910 [Thermoanaerobaculia bacterium]